MTRTPERMDALRRFAAGASGSNRIEVEPASADASFRSYWRVEADGHPARVVMDAPPDKEDIGPWLDIGRRLRAAGLHAPAVLAVDREQGFVLMEDLGSRTYLPALNDATVDALYADALDALLRMQTHIGTDGLPAYDRDRLVAEMELLPEWFLARHLDYTPTCEEWDVIEAAFTFLVHAALEQPRAFVHRDYHSRNLLITDDEGAPGLDRPALPNPAIIDFQDGVSGPISYDLVSLLRDCYIEWPPQRIDGWVEAYRQRLRHARIIDADVDQTRFRRWFDLIGVQRHLKVLGIFCRLWYRDGKPQYLADLPLVWRYVTTVASGYPQLETFVALLERARGGRDITQARETA
ncbi:aminoglycoside phosphotransferase family protein [Dokdonella sp.]|uniref:aminoglycoside phosphotransferase family protein n=1 Tax=Dokdonella sp. TaxID=2291710 RepID=UPI003784FBFC